MFISVLPIYVLVSTFYIRSGLNIIIVIITVLIYYHTILRRCKLI